jgi:carotenoid cleavage dioxygenase-like enzyme
MITEPTNQYISNNFAPVSETTAFDLAVEGEIPLELEGRFLRIGPNPVNIEDPAAYHWFMGTGMVHGLRLRGGRAEWYRSRYVLDANAAATLARPALPGPGRDTRDSRVNTNLMAVAGRTFAVVEAGALPVEINYELESVARCDFEGTLDGGFSAHPCHEPESGAHHVIAYEPGRPSLRYLVVDKSGRARTVADVPTPHFPMVHDVAVTETSVVLLDLPVTFRPDGSSSFPYAWNPNQEPRVGLLPRSGDLKSLQWFSAPSCFVFHIMNVYDHGTSVIVDVARHPRMFDKDKCGPSEGRPVLARWTLDRTTGRLSEQILDDRGSEFPRLNGAHRGLPYRYGYTAYWGENLAFGPAMKHDVTTAQTWLHDYGVGRVTLEPTFIHRKGDPNEDGGWIMSFVYDAGRDASDVVILDAQDFAGKALATIRLPVRVPFGFHGGWAPEVA